MAKSDQKRFRRCQCGKEMSPGNGCLFNFFETKSGKELERIPHSEQEFCNDCNVGFGQYHHSECNVERCPHCGQQALGCEELIALLVVKGS